MQQSNQVVVPEPQCPTPAVLHAQRRLKDAPEIFWKSLQRVLRTSYKLRLSRSLPILGRRMRSKLLMFVAVATMTMTPAAHADFMFTEDFTGPTLNPNFEATNDFGGYSIDGTIGNLSNSERQYIRTVDSDYRNFDFRLTLNHDFFVSNDIAFVGIGNGSPDGAFSNEPGFGSLMFRFHNPALAGGQIDLAFWESGNDFFEGGLGNITSTNEPARVGIRRVGDLLTLSFDTDFNGTFTPDVVRSFDLSESQYAALKTSLDAETRLFFGSTFGTRFDDFVVTQGVPEPTTGLIAAVVFATTLLKRRR